VDNRWCEDPTKVKEEIRNKLFLRFGQQCKTRVRLDNIHFPTITADDNIVLMREFSEEEVKKAIRDCDGSKNPGPNNSGILLRMT